MKGSIQEEPVFSFQRQDQLLLEEKESKLIVSSRTMVIKEGSSLTVGTPTMQIVKQMSSKDYDRNSFFNSSPSLGRSAINIGSNSSQRRR